MLKLTPVVLALAIGLPPSAVWGDDDKPADPAVTAEKKHKHTNRLIDEKSPYLLQHAHNPVDWYPWGDEAFAKAKKEGKPILLSIGYSTCHWCHVMERESFENEEIAKIMNEHFVCIKLDREERPDVDKIYISAVQALSGGSAGWPLNVFLTPDRKPFYGGTYFPPKAAPGRPSWPDLCERIAAVWKERREDVIRDADNIAAQISKALSDNPGAGGEVAEADLKRTMAAIKPSFDKENGGWGGAPKFPRPSQPAFLLVAGTRFGDQEAIDQVLATCEMMASGGMYDQLGGGFCRYSVDAEWLVPHFEKMLYDNAQLVDLYLDAYLVSGEEKFAAVARGVLRYVLRDMTHREGGFYSAEDADSEGKEGKFYCWTKAELGDLLSAEEFAVAVRYFGITEKGNFHDHSDPEALPNQNVLSVADPKLGDGEAALLASAKAKMMKERDTRVRPGLDDKVLTSWNGLMLGAFARAYGVLGEEAYLAAAEKNFAFLAKNMWDGEAGRLYHRWRDGARDSAQILDSHAYLLDGAIELYGVNLDPAVLSFAIALADRMLDGFYDPEAGGFYQSDGSKDLIMRLKEDHDGAEPSGNSVAALALLKLGEITGEARFREAAEKTLSNFAGAMRSMGISVPYMLTAADFAASKPNRVVIAGGRESEDSKALIQAAHSVFQPHKVVMGTAGPVEEFAKTLDDRGEGAAQVFLCKGEHCELPTADSAKVKTLLLKP